MDYSTVIAKIKEIEDKKQSMKKRQQFESNPVSVKMQVRENDPKKVNFNKYILSEERKTHEDLLKEEKETDFQELVM